jgi:hypothetical protein
MNFNDVDRTSLKTALNFNDNTHGYNERKVRLEEFACELFSSRIEIFCDARIGERKKEIENCFLSIPSDYDVMQ